MKQLGPTAREVREALGFSQKDAANRLGVSSVYLCNIEKGKAMPSHSFLQTFKTWSGVDLYVAAWCRQDDYDQLPKSVKGISKKLAAVWKKEIDGLREQTIKDAKNVENSKTRSPR
jgi:transcriptional regulator with XRE-family HTH domain